MANAELGILLSSLRGKVGNAVFQKAKGGGTTVRIRVKGTNPKTPAQVAVRSNLTRASQAYKNMTTPQIAAWKTYASTLTFTGKKSSRKYAPTAIDAFTELAAKFLQINPSGTIPLTPPSASFAGDTITVTATGGTGLVTFTASGPNGTNIKTELLLQTLKSKNRTPQPKQYRSKAFFAFLPGTLSTTVAVPTGFYAAGYRFVNTLTGQETPMVPLTVLTVALSVEEGGKKKAA